MQAITVVGLDIAKSVFQVHGVNAHGSVVIRRQLKRRYVVAFFKKLPPCLIGIEACATPHHWSRFKTLMELGNKAPALCLWCFDLLHLNGVRITPLALAERCRFKNFGRAACRCDQAAGPVVLKISVALATAQGRADARRQFRPQSSRLGR